MMSSESYRLTPRSVGDGSCHDQLCGVMGSWGTVSGCHVISRSMFISLICAGEPAISHNAN